MFSGEACAGAGPGSSASSLNSQRPGTVGEGSNQNWRTRLRNTLRGKRSGGRSKAASIRARFAACPGVGLEILQAQDAVAVEIKDAENPPRRPFAQDDRPPPQRADKGCSVCVGSHGLSPARRVVVSRHRQHHRRDPAWAATSAVTWSGCSLQPTWRRCSGSGHSLRSGGSGQFEQAVCHPRRLRRIGEAQGGAAGGGGWRCSEAPRREPCAGAHSQQARRMRWRSRRLMPKAATAPKRGRGPGTGLTGPG